MKEIMRGYADDVLGYGKIVTPVGKQLRVEEGPLAQAAQEFVESNRLVSEGNHLLSQAAIHCTHGDAILQKYHLSSS
jgi:hypothetical protein